MKISTPPEGAAGSSLVRSGHIVDDYSTDMVYDHGLDFVINY